MHINSRQRRRDARVFRKAKNQFMCRSCAQRGPLVWFCTSCMITTTRGYSRCKSCSHLKPRATLHCEDCGTKLKGGKRVCLQCHNIRQDKGLSRERTLFNVSPAWSKARTACFERDDYTCQECDDRGGYLNAHHILSYRSHPELRLSTGNLLTVCRPCHRAIHSSQIGYHR